MSYCHKFDTYYLIYYVNEKYIFFRSNCLEVSHTEEVECTGNVATTAFNSNLVMVKTASGKNVLLKVVPQAGNVSRHLLRAEFIVNIYE